MKRRMLPLLFLVCSLLWGCGGKKKAPAQPGDMGLTEVTPQTFSAPAPSPTAEATAEATAEPTEEPAPAPSSAPTPAPEPLHLLYNGAEVNSLTAKENTTFTISSDAAADEAVSFSSDNEAVITVDQTGKVVALAQGNATVSVQSGNRSGYCKVTVIKPVKPTVSICFLNKPKTDITMNASNNERVQLTAVVTPSDSRKTTVWSSTDSAIAEVDETGLVTAISQGTCEVVCRCGDSSARCWVRVKGQRINYVKAPDDENSQESAIFITCNGYVNSDFTIQLGESVNMDYKLVHAEESEVNWSVQNPAVASVDQNGVVTGLKEGTTVLTVSCGSLSCNSTVRVKG